MKQKHSRKMLLIFLCAAIFILFILYFVSLIISNNEAPVITINSNVNQFSVNLTDEDLLEGVSAVDKEDGDVTDSILIESLSKFSAEKTRTVTYVAFDSNNNVTKLTREISYTDYVSPEITAKDDLEFTLGVTEKEILSHLSCIDVIDGDISNKIELQSNNLVTTRRGVNTVTFGITNSCGDSSAKSFDIIITG